MSTIRISSRYAKSLLDLAKDGSKIDVVKGDLKLFRDAISNRDLALMIKSPIIKADKKLSIFKAIFNDKVDVLTSSFFDIVIKKGRESLLPEIAQSFEDQYNEMHGITKAYITLAAEMNDELLDKIKNKISALGVDSTKIEINKTIDPSIIGGFILQVGDKLYDASIKTKLAKSRKELVDNTYIKS
jgi:F-type H+-transporting ATPase subunit delta